MSCTRLNLGAAACTVQLADLATEVLCDLQEHASGGGGFTDPRPGWLALYDA